MPKLFTQWAMGPCFWCGRETYRAGNSTVKGFQHKPWHFTRDHVFIKRQRGGATGWRSAKLRACFECNNRRGSRLFSEFLRELRPGAETEAMIKLVEIFL